MKRKVTVLLLFAVVLSLVSVVPANAKAPLTGEMDLQFNVDWPGPQAATPDWVGTITIDGDKYGMAFFAIGSGKPFAANPKASAFFFEEIWKIYDDLTFAFDEKGSLAEFVPGDVVMWGYDTGLSGGPQFAPGTFRIN